VVVCGVLFLVAAIAGSFFLEAAPEDLEDLPPVPDLGKLVGQHAEIRGRDRGPAPRHLGPPIAGKAPHWVRVKSGRILVHLPPGGDCPGILVVHGTVIEHRSSFNNRAPVSYQLDAESSECRH
jgi:hypothetical protein